MELPKYLQFHKFDSALCRFFKLLLYTQVSVSFEETQSLVSQIIRHLEQFSVLDLVMQTQLKNQLLLSQKETTQQEIKYTTLKYIVQLTSGVTFNRDRHMALKIPLDFLKEFKSEAQVQLFARQNIFQVFVTSTKYSEFQPTYRLILQLFNYIARQESYQNVIEQVIDDIQMQDYQNVISMDGKYFASLYLLEDELAQQGVPLEDSAPRGQFLIQELRFRPNVLVSKKSRLLRPQLQVNPISQLLGYLLNLITYLTRKDFEGIASTIARLTALRPQVARLVSFRLSVAAYSAGAPPLCLAGARGALSCGHCQDLVEDSTFDETLAGVAPHPPGEGVPGPVYSAVYSDVLSAVVNQYRFLDYGQVNGQNYYEYQHKTDLFTSTVLYAVQYFLRDRENYYVVYSRLRPEDALCSEAAIDRFVSEVLQGQRLQFRYRLTPTQLVLVCILGTTAVNKLGAVQMLALGGCDDEYSNAYQVQLKQAASRRAALLERLRKLAEAYDTVPASEEQLHRRATLIVNRYDTYTGEKKQLADQICRGQLCEMGKAESALMDRLSALSSRVQRLERALGAEGPRPPLGGALSALNKKLFLEFNKYKIMLLEDSVRRTLQTETPVAPAADSQPDQGVAVLDDAYQQIFQAEFDKYRLMLAASEADTGFGDLVSTEILEWNARFEAEFKKYATMLGAVNGTETELDGISGLRDALMFGTELDKYDPPAWLQ